MTNRKRLFFWLPSLGWMAVIFYLSHQPTIPIEPLFPHQDKVFHFTAYFVLTTFLCFACRANRYTLFWAVVVAAFYGVTDEFHQSFVPGRDVSLLDWLADITGSLAAYFFFDFVVSRWKLRFFEEYPRRF